MFNLQANSTEISNGIKMDLDMELMKIGLSVTAFNCSNFSYPQEVQEMQTAEDVEKATEEKRSLLINEENFMGMFETANPEAVKAEDINTTADLLKNLGL
jgi:membrane protease subunit (stomatin/prohibitin family)